MRVGLANFRPCIRFHSPCAATALALNASAFSFAIGTLFFIAVILFYSSKRHGMLRIDEGLLDKNWRPSQKTAVETKVSRMWCSGYICVRSCLAFIYNQHHENDINSIFQLPHLGAPQACGLALRTLGPAFDSILLVRRQLLR